MARASVIGGSHEALATLGWLPVIKETRTFFLYGSRSNRLGQLSADISAVQARMKRARERARRLLGVAIVAVVVSVAFPLRASGHASDFETLTLDFLFGPKGLEAVDAAVVESKGPGYEPFPTSAFKRDVALDVLQSLRVPLHTVDIDVEMSERYHEVGFLVRFDAPSVGMSSPLLIDTSRLQRVASKARLSRLKLSMCGVTDGGGAPDEDMNGELQIQASKAGRSPVDEDREACQVWSVEATDEPISIAVGQQGVWGSRRYLVFGAVGALTVILVAAALLVARTRRPRSSAALESNDHG